MARHLHAVWQWTERERIQAPAGRDEEPDCVGRLAGPSLGKDELHLQQRWLRSRRREQQWQGLSVWRLLWQIRLSSWRTCRHKKRLATSWLTASFCRATYQCPWQSSLWMPEMATPTTISRWWTVTTSPLQSFYSRWRTSPSTTCRLTSRTPHVREQTDCSRNKTTTRIPSTLNSSGPTARTLCHLTRKWIRNKSPDGVLGISNSLPPTSPATACIRIPTTISNDRNSTPATRPAPRTIDPKTVAQGSTTRPVNANQAITRKM
jgi:hypothetical protein